ncbi:rngB [Symbiodinium sp. CCMP2592]|nr:rngB [Symbiodinium sp. CCMP2592]
MMCFLSLSGGYAGLECESDAWSDFTPAASPAGRQDASMVWDSETQSAWMFGGHASNAFLYFADLWRYDWPRRAWTEILPLSEGPAPGARWGHAAVWHVHSRSMLVFGGKFQVTFYDDIWQFRSEDGAWGQLPALGKPLARAYHTAILDPSDNAVLVFGGESGSQVLEDLQRYSLADGQWSESLTPGPGARSRHTAVWVPTTRSMLVFGGWSGQQYLDDLHSYDASAGTWAEVSAAGYWPTARAGHAAAWDPVSMSMLVMGGITNVTSDLSYDASIYNYSLLTNSWKEEGLQRQLLGPTGRTGHGIVWDYASRGLLCFGGFNASYLQQTWRYVVSQTSSPLLVSCQQGRNCSFRWNASGSVAAKRTCSDQDILGGLPSPLSEAEEEDLWTFGVNASPFFTQPGHHRLCWCDVVNCSHPDNFSVTVGYFVLEGPQLQQSAQCYLGRDCTISEWRGVGISANDSVVMQSRCGEGPRLSSSTYSQRSVGVSFNESYGWHTLHVGFLDPAEGLKPEALELCWCPAAAAPCASAEDFLVVALSLDVICPPGEYSEGPGSSCLPCPANFFCPGGSELQSCPSSSTSMQGSSLLSDCRCLRGRYWDAESAICLACPAGSSTLQEGATSLASCTCMPGFFATQPDNPAVCEACGVGFFCAGGLQTPQPCAPSQTTESDTSANRSQCVCRPGSFLEDGLCALCPVGFFKGSVGDFPCSPCGTGTFSNGTGSTEPCRCQQGYGFDEEIAQCRPCLPGEYKALVGDTPCSRCSTNKTSVEGATSPLDCRCRSGLAAEGESCRDCRDGFFCPGQGEERRCQDDATSRRGSILQADCLCLPGYYALEAQGICEPCQPGRYKPTLANDPSCPLQCPTNGQSANASTNLTECFCMPGFYAVLDEGSLSRCASCAFLPHVQCLGGFHTQAGITQLGNHKLPVARPGYFQTGVTIAVKCTADTSTGLSACLGGQLCAQDDTVECFGKYSNACDEGSTGFFCGECPAGWARRAFQQPCEPCAAGAVLPLVASVIIDVGTKATINFVVAAMAAMAAVRASSKLHTVMIRIAVQWLAACSVLTAFDLTQIPLENAETQGDQEEYPLFPWPVQVSAAMRGLFETLTLTPVLTSVNSATQCFAQELAPDSTAPRIAFGVYHLALPLLVMIGILLLSFLVVHVVVPLGERFGFSFNESGRSMNHLCKIIDPMLKEILRKPVAEASITTSRTSDAFSWADLERTGTLGNLTTAQLQQAAENPDGFLRTAAAGSRELLVSACAARAAQLHPQAEAQELYQELAKADLRQFLTADFATRSPDFTAMLDKVLDAAFTFDEETVPVPKEGPEQEEADELRLVGSEHAPCDVVVALPTDAMPEKKPGEKSTFSFTSLENRASLMDSLNFGLFSPAPRFVELAYQSVPILWVSLVSLWPGLLSSFLQMIWCVSVLEDDVLVSRLLPNPSVVCWSDEHLVSARFAIAGLVVWCLGIPIALAIVLFRLPDRQAPDNFRRFGYFFQGLERQFWWWDLLVKRFAVASDLALMMLVAYTSVVPDQKAKLALFPVLSAFQALLAAWVRPYANDQAEVLDVLEVTLCSIRFLLFSGVALLLSLEVAYLLLLVLVLACLYFFTHFTAQVWPRH